MRNLILFGLLIMFLVAVQFASAQTVDEVIDKYISARGGRDKLASIKTLYMEGSREMMGTEVTVKVTKEQNKLSRTEFEMGGKNGFMLVTDKEGWNYFPMRMQEPKKMPDQVVVLKQTDLDIAGPLVDYPAKEHKAELLGKEMVGTNNCFKIKLTSKAGPVINYWIDTASYLLLQSSSMADRVPGARADNNQQAADSKTPSEVFIVYKDYKAVDGILFPHTIEITYKNGESRNGGGTTFDKIEINKPLDAKLYKPE